MTPAPADQGRNIKNVVEGKVRDMYYRCLNLSCETSFDADTAPLTCPFCGSDEGFAKVRIAKNGRELTYAEHINSLREYYPAHLPYGMSKTDITRPGA